MKPQERLAEAIATNVTPFTDSGAVDLDKAASQARWMVDRGVKVMTPAGNTGEFTSLSLQEAKEVVQAVADEVKDEAFILAGVGYSSPIAIELANAAEAAGAHAAMVHAPSHTFIDPEGLRRYFEALIAETSIPLVLYKREDSFTDDLLADLVHHERIVGVKYGKNDVSAFATIVDRTKDADVAWICGTTERWAPFFALGGSVGFTSGVINFTPELAVAMQEALRQKDFAEAMELRARVLELELLRQTRNTGNNVPVVKEAMRQMGLDNGLVRDPVLQPDDELSAKIAEELAKLSLTGM